MEKLTRALEAPKEIGRTTRNNAASGDPQTSDSFHQMNYKQPSSVESASGKGSVITRRESVFMLK
jgi:hypothetical protein